MLGRLYTGWKVRLARDGKASQAGLGWSGKARKAWAPPKGMRLVTKYGLLQSLVSELARHLGKAAQSVGLPESQGK